MNFNLNNHLNRNVHDVLNIDRDLNLSKCKPIENQETRKLTVLSVYGFCRIHSPKNNVYRVISNDIIKIMLKYYYLPSNWAQPSKSNEPLYQIPKSKDFYTIIAEHRRKKCDINPTLIDTETITKALSEGLKHKFSAVIADKFIEICVNEEFEYSDIIEDLFDDECLDSYIIQELASKYRLNSDIVRELFDSIYYVQKDDDTHDRYIGYDVE